MGVCANCIYIGQKTVKEEDTKYFESDNYICESENNAVQNYITGEKELATCISKNRYGQCPFFVDITYDPENDPQDPSKDPDNDPETPPEDPNTPST